MPTTTDILDRRKTHFLVWNAVPQNAAPQLIIGQLQPGNPPTLVGVQTPNFTAVAGVTGLYQLDASTCNLKPGNAYHYWLQIDDTQNAGNRIAVTDPFATCVDWRLYPPNAPDQNQPASVIWYAGNGQLSDADPGGETAKFELPDAPDQLAPNNRLVIYELPTAWAMSRSLNQPEEAVGTFRDVAALVDERIGGANFAELSILDLKNAYLVDLGINALELLPPADSFFKRQWGYDTSHYLAPDFELGYPDGDASPTANQDLASLVSACHRKNIRFFVDSVMAFAHQEPSSHIDFPDFCIQFDTNNPPNDPDAFTSGRAPYGQQDVRNGFGSTLWRYSKQATMYDPITGTSGPIFPARQLMLAALSRWMRDFRVDGWRLDSVENVASWDFVQAYKDRARGLWLDRWTSAGLDPQNGAQERFLVVGEELSLPTGLLTQGRLDGLWNEDFQTRVRAAILGESVGSDNFEWTVRKCIDIRLNNVFTDGAQAINYVTKHDVEGFRHERLFTQLRGLSDDLIESKIKLAFVCLMTAVGIPMFLAGEEFADQHDFFDENGNVSQNGGKQINPVNFSRLTAGPPDPSDTNARNDNPDAYFGPMRRRIRAYVKLLIKLRTSADALSVNDTNFIWTDFNDGKQVIVWQRGTTGPGAPPPVIVVANFSDFNSGLAGQYVIPTWPGPAPAGQKWVEVTQQRDVLPSQVGSEPIFPWEAKVYTYANA